MKTRIVPGAEIETVTPLEASQLIAELLGAGGRPQVPLRAEQAGKTDAGGNATVYAYTVPPGMGFRLTRVLVQADGFTPGAPFTGAGAYLEIIRNDVMVDFLPLTVGSGGSLPSAWSESESDAPYYANGDAAGIRVNLGPATTGLLVRIQGELLAVAPEDGKPAGGKRRRR